MTWWYEGLKFHEEDLPLDVDDDAGDDEVEDEEEEVGGGGGGGALLVATIGLSGGALLFLDAA